MTMEMVDKAVFDDVVRTCSDSVDRSKRYMTICHGMVSSLELVLDLLKSGRIERARVELESAVRMTARLLNKGGGRGKA